MWRKNRKPVFPIAIVMLACMQKSLVICMSLLCNRHMTGISVNPYIAANSNLEQTRKLKPAIFVFTGVCHDETQQDLVEFAGGLYQRLKLLPLILNTNIIANQLTLTLTNPDFRFYISLIKQNQLEDFNQLAGDFGLPWDGNEINHRRLANMYGVIDKERWYPFKPYHEVGFAILEELEKMVNVTPYSVPSMGN
jgi:hypothetical protein